MKRHLVMDLFHGEEKTPVGDWSDKHPDIETKGVKVWAKLRDGTELFAYYYRDKPSNYNINKLFRSYFWDCKTKEPIDPIMWKRVE